MSQLRDIRSTGGERQVLLQNPYHEYAVRFIELGARKYGCKAVCVYTDPRERIRQERSFPILRSDLIAASYDAGRIGPKELAGQLAGRHRIAAVLPFNEPGVLPAAELAQELGLSWGQPAIVGRIADKFALKEHLRGARPDLGINASRRVDGLADVLAARALPVYRRFVLKPVSGFGNRDIGVFDAASPIRRIEAYLHGLAGVPVLMEEYIDGLEYFVNGQIDAAGAVVVFAAFQYIRIPANGRDNIDFETLLVRRADPKFDVLAQYASAVVSASGLRRSPFHVELKLDQSGPRLIEVGARLAGLGNAWLCNHLHSSKLDLMDLAMHYYLHDSEYGPLHLDWKSYDASAVRYVHGIAARSEYVYRIDGVRAVEALPEFHAWVNRPTVGVRLKRTTDILTMPYSLILKGRRQADLAVAAERVRGLLRWNRSVGVARRLRLNAQLRLERYAMGLRVRVVSLWRGALAHRLPARFR